MSTMLLGGPETEQPVSAPPAAPQRRRPPPITPIGLGASVALAATTVAAAAGLIRVFPDWSFFPRMVVVALTVHLLCLIGRVRGWHLATVAAGSAAAIAVLVGMIYLPDTMSAGVLPTRSTWDAAWQSIADSFSQFRVTVTPVPATGGFGITCALALGVIAFVADSFAFRAYGRIEAVIPGGLLFVVASSVGYDRSRLATTAWWLVAAFVAVAWLRAAHDERSAPWLGATRGGRLATLAGASLGAAVAATIAGLAIGPGLPGAEAEALVDTRHSQGDGTEVLSPMVSIQARLVDRRNVELFTVTTDAPQYWRLTAFESFDGTEWRQERDYSDADRLAGADDVGGVRQQFQIASLGSIWLPAAFSPVGFDSGTSVRFNAESASIIRNNGDLFTGLDYEVVSEVPTASAAELAGSTSSDPPTDDYTRLPDDFPDEFRTLASQITADATSAYDKALALQQFFRDNFRYDVNIPRGHSERAMETFLRKRVGYCEQFAGTFAALGRAAGLATRVATGFTPGDLDDSGVYHVRGKHAHAWPEVWFDGIGWVLFEPTPGRGAPGAEGYTGVAPAQEGGVLTDEADAVPAGSSGEGGAPATTAVASVGTNPILPDGLDPGEIPTGEVPAATLPPLTGGGSSSNASTIVRLVLIGLVAAALWFVAMRPGYRLLRRRAAHSPTERLIESWRRASIALAGAGAKRREAETPLEYAERAWKMTGCDRAAVRRIAELVTNAAYGDREPSPELADEGDVTSRRLVRVLERRATGWERFRRRMDPRQA